MLQLLPTETALHHITSCFTEAAQLFRLEVSLKKTEILHQPSPQGAHHPPRITIGHSELKSAHQFSYLGCMIFSNAKLDKESDSWLAKASTAFERLSTRLGRNRHPKKHLKISVYQAVALTTLLYGAESWVIYRRHLQLLECFHQCCLCSILNIHWSDFITNIEVLKQVEITRIEAMLLQMLLRWAGHISQMEDHRLPKIALHGSAVLCMGPQGSGTKATWKSPWAIATSTTTSGLCLLLTVRPGDTSSTRLSPPLKTATGTTMKTRQGERTTKSLHPAQTWP